MIALRSLSDDKKILAWVKKELEVKRKAQKDNASFEWCYSKTDLSELVYALYHSDAIKKEVVLLLRNKWFGYLSVY